MQTTQRSLWIGIGIAAVAAVLGVAGLPLLFGVSPDRGQSVLWLAVAVIACVCVLLPTRGLATAVATALTAVPEQRGMQAAWSRHAATDLARLIIAAGYLLLLQAILRHPAVAVFGASAEPFVIEAAIAVFALIVLLVLLGSIYREGRPLIEGLAWSALDSLFATSGSEHVSRGAANIGPVVTSTMVAPAGSGATITRVAAQEAATDETLARSAHVEG